MPLPVLAKGDECRLVEAELKEMKTTPPRHYTEGTLIAAMKNAAGMVSDPALKKCYARMPDWARKQPVLKYWRHCSPANILRNRVSISGQHNWGQS